MPKWIQIRKQQMNLIFLDFDETLTNTFHRHLNKKKIYSEKNNSINIYNPELMRDTETIDFHIYLKSLEIDPECMRNFAFLVKETNSKVVICSTWRKIAPFNNLGDENIVNHFNILFEKLGYNDIDVIGYTPIINFRGAEVATYLDEFSKNNHVDKYLILDDGADFFIHDLSIMTEDEVLNYAHIGNNPDKPIFKKIEDYKSKSHFWRSQPLLRPSPLYGLTKNDIILALGHFKPEHNLCNHRRESEPYKVNQGIFNSSESICIEIGKREFKRIKP